MCLLGFIDSLHAIVLPFMTTRMLLDLGMTLLAGFRIASYTPAHAWASHASLWDGYRGGAVPLRGVPWRDLSPMTMPSGSPNRRTR